MTKQPKRSSSFASSESKSNYLDSEDLGLISSACKLWSASPKLYMTAQRNQSFQTHFKNVKYVNLQKFTFPTSESATSLLCFDLKHVLIAETVYFLSASANTCMCLRSCILFKQIKLQFRAITNQISAESLLWI